LPAGPNGCGPKYGLYDEAGNLTNASLLDFFLPTSVETPGWETDFTTTPSPHHPIGAKGVGESPNVGGVSAFSNAVNDAFAQQLRAVVASDVRHAGFYRVRHHAGAVRGVVGIQGGVVSGC
jgi:hypothetical protein